MLLIKYKPTTIAGMIANRMQAGELKRAVAEWKRGSGIIVSGPPGCGKTLAIELAANELDIESVAGTYDELAASCTQSSIWNRGKLLVGDIDSDLSVGNVSELVENSRWPLVLVTCDIYQRNLADLRKDSRMKIIQFQKIRSPNLANFLAKICRFEGIAFSDRMLYELAQRSDGDVRWALLALESLKSVDASVSELDRDRIERIFDTLDSLFQKRTNEFDIALMPWIVENLPEKYSGEELVQAYKCVSAANRFCVSGMEWHAQQALKLLPRSRMAAQYKMPRWHSNNAAVSGAHCSAKKSKAYLQVLNILQRHRVGRNGNG